MEVEVESYAESVFFLEDFDAGDGTGVKKRYAQLVTWDEGSIPADPEPQFRGFELVRSDSSEVTTRVQRRVLEIILQEDESAKESVREYLRGEWNDVLSGYVNLESIGKPSAIRNPLWDYGWSTKQVGQDESIVIDGRELGAGEEYYTCYTPQPHIRGARYANEYISGEDLGEGSKPRFFYVEDVDASGDLPETYDYSERSLNAPENLPCLGKREITELGNEVDAISVEDVRNLPSAICVDWEKMAEKNLRNPIEPIVRTMGWSFDDLTTEGKQTDIAQFM